MQIGERFAVFDARQTYRQDLHDYWASLEQVSALPDDLVIRKQRKWECLRVSIQKKVIIDLAALNDAWLMKKASPRKIS